MIKNLEGYYLRAKSRYKKGFTTKELVIVIASTTAAISLVIVPITSIYVNKEVAARVEIALDEAQSFEAIAAKEDLERHELAATQAELDKDKAEKIQERLKEVHKAAHLVDQAGKVSLTETESFGAEVAKHVNFSNSEEYNFEKNSEGVILVSFDDDNGNGVTYSFDGTRYPSPATIMP